MYIMCPSTVNVFRPSGPHQPCANRLSVVRIRERCTSTASTYNNSADSICLGNIEVYGESKISRRSARSRPSKTNDLPVASPVDRVRRAYRLRSSCCTSS